MAPAEHEVKNGKRVFGWLVRFLLRQPPSCDCADCTARYQALVPDHSKYDYQSAEISSTRAPKLWRSIKRVIDHSGNTVLGEDSPFRVGNSVVGFGGGAVQLVTASQLFRKDTTDATNDSEGHVETCISENALAIVADGTTPVSSERERVRCVNNLLQLESFLTAFVLCSIPSMLMSRKVGWKHCGILVRHRTQRFCLEYVN